MGRHLSCRCQGHGQVRCRQVDVTPRFLVQDPGDFWDAATLVDAFNARKDPNDTLLEAQQSFTDYYLLSSGWCHGCCASNISTRSVLRMMVAADVIPLNVSNIQDPLSPSLMPPMRRPFWRARRSQRMDAPLPRCHVGECGPSALRRTLQLPGTHVGQPRCC